MSYEKIVTLFDTLAHAQAAERNLVKAGFSESAISLLKNEDIDRSDLDGDQSFWSKLFGETITDEDRVIYSEAIRNNGTVLTVHVEEEERAKALAILNRHQLSDETRYNRQTLAGTEPVVPVTPVPATDVREDTLKRPYLTGDETQDEILRLAKEDLEVGKRIESEGSKRIRRYVVEHDVSKTVNLREQHAEVLRRKVDQPIDGNIDWTDKEIAVEEYVEKPVINKNAKVVEEVVVKKVNTDHDEVIKDTVREQKVDVVNDGKTVVDPTLDPKKTF